MANKTRSNYFQCCTALSSSKPIPVATDQDMLARQFIKLMTENDITAASSLIDKAVLAQSSNGAMENLAKQVQGRGLPVKIQPIFSVESKGNIFGKPDHHVASLTYAIQTQDQFVYEAWMQFDLEAQPISILGVKFSPMGYENEIRALVPSGKNAEDPMVWVVNTLICLFAIGFLAVIVLALKRTLQSQLSHRWAWALLAFVNVFAVQYFPSNGVYHGMLKLTILSLPASIGSLTSFYPRFLLMQIPAGAIFLLFKFRKKVAKPQTAETSLDNSHPMPR